MTPEMRLGHLVFGVKHPQAWRAFCADTLGLPTPASNPDGSLGWQVDGATQRLVVQGDASDDLLALGLECRDEQALASAVRRLREAGVDVHEGTAAERAARRVQSLVWTTDPAGNRVELVTGVEAAPDAFASAAFPSGFVTGELGLGHAVLVSPDLQEMEAFYTLLGFGVTERLNTKVGPVTVRGIFLHCNRRHHSLALFDLPSRKRLHHFMLQAREHMDVGMAFERARAAKVPLSLTLGQHPAPDATFSFYGATPSGFDFEVGAGSREIDPRGWETMHTRDTSAWGHRPQWSLKLRMAGALLSRRRGARAAA